MSTAQFLNFKKVGFFCLSLALLSSPLRAAEPASPDPVTAIKSDAANLPPQNSVSNESLNAYLQLQEQIHATQLAIEKNREEAQIAAAQAAETLSNRLQTIEQSLVTQRSNQLEAMQSANRLMLFAIGLFAAIGFMAVLLTAYFQWRAIHRLGEISATLPASRGFGALPEVATLGLDERQLGNSGAVEQSNARLLGVIDRLEKRISELEHASRPALPEPTPMADNSAAPTPQASADAVVADKTGQVALLLGKGQSLLYLDQPEEAVACFNEALAFDPNNTEALVKKGAALEKLRKLEEAIECYDQAIAADHSMTIAYLYKGGLYNRMERFSEAMECYERALQTQEKKRAA